MTRVDPHDDSIERWVAFHFRYDPERNERRNVIVAAFDTEADFRVFLDRAGSELRAAIANGDAEQVEHLGGWRWPAGKSADQAKAHQHPKAPRPRRVRKHHQSTSTPPPPAAPSHWVDWHRGYLDPQSPLSQRLAVVIDRTRQALDALPPGPIRLISACAGQARDVVGALQDHARAGDVTGLLVEADPHNAAVAQGAVTWAGLTGIQTVCADAGVTDAYTAIAPADLVLLCGIFGNITDEDVHTTVAHAAMLCTPGAYVLWTRHRDAPDLTPTIREWFAASGFEEMTSPSCDGDFKRSGERRSA